MISVFEVRMRALELAIAQNAPDVIAAAKLYADFIIGADDEAAEQPEDIPSFITASGTKPPEPSWGHT